MFHGLDVPERHQSRAEAGLEPEEQELLSNDLFEQFWQEFTRETS